MSAASVWETAIKRSLGKLPGTEPLSLVSVRNGFELLPVLPKHAEQVASLPHLHRDPFDRMLVAQAMFEGLTLVTQDATLARYNVQSILV